MTFDPPLINNIYHGLELKAPSITFSAEIIIYAGCARNSPNQGNTDRLIIIITVNEFYCIHYT